MNTKQKKFAAYATLSAAFLTTHRAEAQVIYHDINPDILTSGFSFPDYELDVDLDEDGLNEFTVIGKNYSTTSDYAFEGTINLSILNDAEFLYVSGDLALLNAGDIIDSAASWIDENNIQILSFDPFIPDEWSDAENKFLGIRFQIDGDYHYGWMRLGTGSYDFKQHYYSPSIMIFDCAYEASAGMPIEAGVNVALPATHLEIKDSISVGTIEDAFLHFKSSDDESTVSEYRVIIAPASPFIDITYDIASALTPDKYISVIPTGEDFTMQITESTADYTGAPILYDNEYRIFILNIADGLNATINTLSIPSNKNNIEDHAADKPYALHLEDVANNGNASDLELNFTAAKNEYSVSSYRIFITSAIGTGYYDYDAEDFGGLSDQYYSVVIADGSENYTIHLDADQLDVNTDSLLKNADEYKALIFSLPDGYYASTSSEVSDSYAEEYSYPATDAIIGGDEPDLSIIASSNSLHISGLLTEVSYDIINESGQTVESGTADRLTSSIDISQLLPGNYFIRLQNTTASVSYYFTKL